MCICMDISVYDAQMSVCLHRCVWVRVSAQMCVGECVCTDVCGCVCASFVLRGRGSPLKIVKFCIFSQLAEKKDYSGR